MVAGQLPLPVLAMVVVSGDVLPERGAIAKVVAALQEPGVGLAGGRHYPNLAYHAAKGAVRVLMDLPDLTGINSEISIGRLLQAAGEPFGGSTSATAPTGDASATFVAERVRYALEQRGYPIEVVRAATSDPDLRPLRARRVAEALQGMRSSPDFQALAVLFKRVKNITHSTRPIDTSGTRSGQANDGIDQPLDRALLAG